MASNGHWQSLTAYHPHIGRLDAAHDQSYWCSTALYRTADIQNPGVTTSANEFDQASGLFGKLEERLPK